MTDRSITEPNRRRVLQLGGTALALALAGCAGGAGGGGATAADTEMDDAESGSGTSDPGTTESAMNDSETTETGMDDSETAGTEMDGSTGQEFRVRIENVSSGDTLRTMDGSVAVPLSPGAFAVHADPGVLFESGAAASEGLERIAEDGTPGALVESLGGMEMAGASGAFDTPVGAASPGPIGPGGAYEFEVAAGSDARLSFATMFVQSNDLFYAPEPEGIPLFADGAPVEGDVTDRVLLWDAGTEVDEPPGEGPNQAPRQSAGDTGDAEDGPVRPVSEVDDGFSYPPVADVIRVTVTPVG
jgi:hypothetical protein